MTYSSSILKRVTKRGYSDKESATRMAELSSQFASISPGMDVETAQKGLVSVMKAFGKTTDEVESQIMDKINYLGNHFAETNEDIIQGLMRSSAAMSAIGEDFESTAALFTGGMEILQNAEKMGTALRSFSLRIRGYSEDSVDGEEQIDEGLKNITGDLINLTKTAQHTQGISVFKDGSTTEFKSMVEYLGEVSEIWDEMNDKQKNSFLQKAFAKTQAQAGSAIITNFDQVRKALEEMENSAGSADKEMDIIRDSWDYKLNKLGETWVGVLQKMVDRKGFGSFFDMLQKMSDGVSALTDTFGGLSTAVAGLFGALAIKGSSPLFSYNMKQRQVNGVIPHAVNSASTLINNIKSGGFSGLKDGLSFKSGQSLYSNLTNKDIVAFSNMNAAIESGVPKMEAYQTTMNGVSKSADILAKRVVIGTESMENISNGFVQVAKTSKLAAFGMKTLSIAGNMLLGMGIGIAINLLIEGIDRLANASKYAEEELDKLSSTVSDLNNKTKSSQDWIDSSAEKFVKLSKGVDKFGHNLSLSDQEYKEYLSLSNQAADLFPGMVTYWDDLGNKIIKAAGGLEDFNKEQERANEDAKIKKGDQASDMYQKFWEGEDDQGNKRSGLYAERNIITDLLNGGIISDNNNKIIKTAIEEYIESNITEPQKEAWNEFLSKNDNNYRLKDIEDLFPDIYPQLELFLENKNRIIQDTLNNSEDAQNTIDSVISAWQTYVPEYLSLTDDMQEKATNVMKTLNMTFLKGLEDQGINPQEWVVDNIIKPLQDGISSEEFPSLVEQLFNIDPADIPYSEYISQIQDIVNKLLQYIPENLVNEYLKKTGLDADFGLLNNKGVPGAGESVVNNLKNRLDNIYNKELAKKAKEWGLDNDLVHQIEINDVQVKFGNIDMDDRPIIEWGKETRQKFAKEMEDWDISDVEDGDISTVLGGSSEFGGHEIAFTPIIKGVDGKGELLSEEALYNYLEKVVAEAERQINEEAEKGLYRTPEEQANALRQRIMQLDLLGFGIGETYTKGLRVVGGVDNYTGTGRQPINARDVGMLMHFSGKYGERQLGQENLDSFLNSLSKSEVDYLNKNYSEEDIKSGYVSIQKLKDDIDGLRKTQEKTNTSTKTFKALWRELGGKDTKSARNELVEMAKAGKLSTEAFTKFKNGKFAKMFEDIGVSAEEAVDRINKLAQRADQLSSMKGGISAILSAYDEKRDAKDNRVGADTLSSLGQTLGAADWKGKDKKVWDDYQKTAASSTATLKELKAAQDELATSYVNNENFLANLDKEHAQYYKDLLTEMGVTNADEVVTNSLKNKTYELEAAKIRLAAADSELQNATKITNDDLDKECEKLGLTGQAAALYKAEIIKASNATIYTDGSIKNLKALGKALGMKAKQAAEYAKIIWQINQIQSGKWAVGDKGFLDSLIKKAEKMETNAGKVGVSVNTNGGSVDPKNGSSSSSNPKNQKKQKQFIDWIERRITRINNIIAKISSHIENIGRWNLKMGKKGVIGQYDAKTIKQQEEYIKKRNAERDDEIKYYKRLYEVQTVAYKKYMKKANSVDKAATRKKTKKQAAGAFAGKKGKAEWQTIVDRITSGDYEKGDFKKQTWYQQLSEKKKNVVDKYIEWYDKAKSSRQARNETSAAARQIKIDKRSEWQTYYDNLQSLAEANEQIASGYKKQNKQVDIQIDYLKASYEQQIAIAKLNGDIVEAKRLAAEEEQKIRELAYHELENIYEDYERDIAVNNRNIQNADNMFQVVNAQGKYANAGWYQSKILNEYEIIQKAIEWRDAEIQKMNDEYYNGTLRKQDYEKAINDILTNFSSQVATSYSNIADNLTAIRDLEDSLYDEVRAQNSKQYERAQFLASLSREGNLNTKDKDKNYYGLTGTGKLNLSVGQVGIVTAEENMRTSAEQLAKVKELEKEIEGMDVATATKYLEDMQKKDPSKYLYSSYKQLKEADDKYTNQYIENVKARQEAENTLIEIMKEYYEGQKTYLGELIDARKKMLDQEKDLYDYSKNINEKTKNLATLQKRMAALSGDNSEEGKARRQRLQTELDQAQQDLQDTEYERWKSDQESMLDNLAEQYNDIIDKHLQDTDGLIKEAKDIVKDNQPEIKDKTQQILDNLTDTLPSNLANAVKDSFSTTTTTLTSDITSIKNALTSETGYLYQILEAIPKSIKDADEDPNNNGGAGEDIPSDVKTSEPPPPSSSKNNAGGTASTDSETRNSEYALYNLLKKYGSKAKKKSASEYKSALNQKLFEFSNRFTGGKDIRILEDDEAAWLMYVEGLHGKATFDKSTAFKESGQIYQILKNIYKIPGFKTGGIGRLVKANGEDGLAMVRNGEGFVMPEHVQSIQQLLNVVPDMTQLANATKNMNNQTTIETLALELPNVQDVPSFINEFQNNKDVQRIFKIAVEDLSKNGNYSSRIYSV